MELVFEYRAEERRHGGVCAAEGGGFIVVNNDKIELGSVLEEGLLISRGDDLGGFNQERVDAKK